MAGITGLNIVDQLDELPTHFPEGCWLSYGFAPTSTSTSTNKKQQDLLVTELGSDEENLFNLHKSLPNNDVRYIVMHFGYDSPTDHVRRTKRLFVMWAPSGATIKDRLKITMYNKEAQHLLSSGCGFNVVMQANEISDISYEAVLAKIRSVSTVY